ncbi:MAG: ABC transporter permease [Rhodothermaceae bacterium]|nr:ABC transporter permease [Rhodothermaceae bacterium]
MGFGEAFRMALDSLRANTTRSVLTLLGMIIGVFAIIVSVTAVEVIDVYFKESMQFLGSSTYSMSRYPPFGRESGGRQSRNRPNITYEQVDRLKKTMKIPVVVSVVDDFKFGAVRYKEKETEPNLVLLGTDENFLGNFSYELEQGRFITEQDVHYARAVAVIGKQLVDELFSNETPLGKTIRMDGQRYEVIGVLKEKGSFLGFSQDNRIVAPITKLFNVYGIPDRNMNSVSMRVLRPEMMDAAMEETIGRMRVIREVRPGEENNFEISTNDSFQSITDSFTGTLTMGGAFIGLIALLSAGIGIMNIMLVSVTERTREIGIRKSIGARRKDIMRQFLLEAFFLCQIGGLLGIVSGALVGNAVAIYFNITAVFPWDWAIIGVVMVTVIAVVFGGFPALKAARLDPIESLRYE